MNDWLKFTAASAFFMLAGATIPSVAQGDGFAFFVGMAFLICGSVVDATRGKVTEGQR